jgi:hypothetical protein
MVEPNSRIVSIRAKEPFRYRDSEGHEFEPVVRERHPVDGFCLVDP